MESEKKEETQEETPDLGKFLENFENSPSKDQVNKWKETYGEVFCSGFSETELFIWRSLNREEHVEMQIQLSQAQEPITAFQVEEHIVSKCILWKSDPGDLALKSKAGSFSTLHEQILQNSNFMNPAMASQLVIRL